MLDDIYQKSAAGTPLSKRDAVELLSVSNTSEEFYRLLAKSNARSRKTFDRGYIFAQIGINSDPCSGNCKFCSLAADNYCVEAKTQKSLAEIAETVRRIDFSKVCALFLMTTADYSKEHFLNIGAAVREMLPSNVTLVANVGDFEEDYAHRLRQNGFGAVYHIVRLREGIDTALPVAQRLRTLDAVKAAGLELYYCVEPIGTEHTYEEIADEMLRARDYQVNVMAVMGRIGVAGTPFAAIPPVTDLELAKIAAVANLVTCPSRSMNIHEPKPMVMPAGINQLYAEIGFNPRDTKRETGTGRGFSVEAVEEILRNAEWSL